MSETPYAPEPPADGDRPPAPPRFSASASVPVPNQPGPGGASYGPPTAPPYGQGGTYGAAPQPPFGQPPIGQPPVGQPPASPPPVGSAAVGSASVGSASVGSASVGSASVAGQARVSGSASVPAPAAYGSSAPPAPPSYGSPAAYGSPAPGNYGAAAPAPAPPYGQPPSQFEGPRQGGSYGPGVGPGSYGSATVGAAPPGGDSDHDERAGRKPRRGLIIVIAIVAVLVVAGVGAYVGLSTKKGPSYDVGLCVVQRGGEAELVGCNTEGAYRIVSAVNSQNECADAEQPWLEITESTGAKTFRCLAPANPPVQASESPPAEQE